MSNSSFEKFKHLFSQLSKSRKILIEVLLMCLVSIIIIVSFIAYDQGGDSEDIEEEIVQQDPEVFAKALAEVSSFPEKIEMNKAKGKTEQAIYSPMDFLHGQHAEDIGCTECHHAVYEVKEGAYFSCSQSKCHNKIGINLDTEHKYKTYYRALHKRYDQRSCVGCHEYLKANDLAYGPTGCFSCHQKVSFKKFVD